MSDYTTVRIERITGDRRRIVTFTCSPLHGRILRAALIAALASDQTERSIFKNRSEVQFARGMLLALTEAFGHDAPVQSKIAVDLTASVPESTEDDGE